MISQPEKGWAWDGANAQRKSDSLTTCIERSERPLRVSRGGWDYPPPTATKSSVAVEGSLASSNAVGAPWDGPRAFRFQEPDPNVTVG